MACKQGRAQVALMHPSAHQHAETSLLRGPKPMLTVRQAEVYNFLANYISTHGYAPTMREVANALYISSTSSIAQFYKIFRDKGLIKTVPGKPRMLELTSKDTYTAVVKVKKRHNGIPSVIEVDGRRYVYDPA